MDFRLPELGEGVYEAELLSWHVGPGDRVRPGQPLMEVLTDKATMEVTAPFGGAITELRVQPGNIMKVGDVVLVYQGEGAPAKSAGAPAKASAAATPVAAKQIKSVAAPPPAKTGQTTAPNGPPDGSARSLPPSAGVRASPSVRLMARKLGIDLAHLKGTGPEGRILLDDLAAQVQKQPGQGRGDSRGDQIDVGVAGSRMPLHGLRRKIAQNMALAKRTIPHYSYVDEIDATALVHLRDSLKEQMASAGIKLTYLAFVVKAAVAALKETPLVNASLTEKEDEIVLHDHYHIGIAVSTPAGLTVPVIHDADKKDLVQIAAEVERLGTQARTGKLQLDELRGATFTITSIGNIGGLFSTPIMPT